jgi:hypothetical protein
MFHKHRRSGAAIKANPLRGGGAKPKDLLKEGRWPGYRTAVGTSLALESPTLYERKE